MRGGLHGIVCYSKVCTVGTWVLWCVVSDGGACYANSTQLPSYPPSSSLSSAHRVLLSSSSSLNPLTRLSNQRHTNQWRHCLCCLCWPTSGWDTLLPFTPQPTDLFLHACCTSTCTTSSACCTISHSLLPELSFLLLESWSNWIPVYFVFRSISSTHYKLTAN